MILISAGSFIQFSDDIFCFHITSFLTIFSHFFILTEVEGQQPSKNTKSIPWGPLYCVLQQDEMSFNAYCSEELSVSPPTTRITLIM